MDLTDGQREAVNLIYFNPRYTLATQELVTRLNADRVHPEWTYDRLMGVLRRLEKREIVVRSDKPARWQLTTKARNHLRTNKLEMMV